MKRSIVLAVCVAGLVAGPAYAGGVKNLMAESAKAEAHGDTQAAIMLMQAAMVADPARAATITALADLYARHHEFDYAHKYYDDALVADPQDAAAHRGLAQLKMEDNKTASAKPVPSGKP